MSKKPLEKGKMDLCFSAIGELINLINCCDPISDIGFEAFSDGNPEAKLSVLSGGGVSERFFDGGAVINLPFRISIRKKNKDSASSADSFRILHEVSGKLLSKKLPTAQTDAKLLSICQTAAPRVVSSLKDGVEEYAADFVLYYFLV